jgi:hypothetical protein
MGLWDILVPAEPGVLHNTIANPSFEYDTGQITKIYGKYSPETRNTTYWNPVAALVSGTITTSAVTFPQNTPVTVTATVAVFSAGDANTKYIFAFINGKYEPLGLVSEYVTPQEVKIANYFYSSALTSVSYTFVVPSLTGSTEWASRGQKSLKIAKGITQNSGFEYYPRATPYKTPSINASLLATGGSLPNSTNITFAVMGLSDVGMSLANGITDAQMQPVLSVALSSHAWIYPSIDSRRGHGTLSYSNTVTTSSTTQQAQLSVLDTSTSRETSPRGWAIWYSTNASMSLGVPTNGTFMLAGVYPNDTSFMDGTITVNANQTALSGTGTAFVTSDANVVYSDATTGRKLYTTKGVFIGQISSVISATSATLSAFAKIKATNIEYRTDLFVTVSNIISGVAPSTLATGTISVNPNVLNEIIGNGTSFQNTDVGRHVYIYSTNGQIVFVGTISNRTNTTQITLSNSVQFVPINASFFLSTETNALSFPNNSQGSLRMFTVASSVISPAELAVDCFAPFWGITNAAYGGFTKKHHLYVDWYLSADNDVNPNTTYTNTGADWSVYLVNNDGGGSETFLGKLDGQGTSAEAKRMGLRTKFLVPRPSVGTNTSDMRLRFRYTGASTSDASLYIDGVQFVDVGMIWRAYDWYGSTIGTSTTPPQFSDWDWDDVEFSYIDGDTPGAMWADSMPTQSGTYSGSFPYITNNGAWLRDQYEYEVPSATTSAGGYAGPRFRLNYQWRGTASPVFGVSIPGLSQSSMQTQTFTTGFWAPLNTENINVIVEPSISGVGMPEIATTSVEYGIVDGGYVQRQVARMRNLQFTITISAQSWTGLHANRRSLINLLKFDQLSQQGERRIRYRGADTPVWMSVTYQSGLEYSGTQGVSFTEALALRFLSTDPYFYVDANITVDASPRDHEKIDFAHVLYKLGSDAEWLPLSHRYYTQTVGSGNQIAGNTYFFDDLNVFSYPFASGWIQSPSGTISALVVGGQFTKPVPYLGIFYVSGYNNGLIDTSIKLKSVLVSGSFIPGAATLTVTPPTTVFSIAGTYNLSAVDIGKHLFNDSNQYIGQIKSVNPNDAGNTTGTFVLSANASSSAKTWYLVEMEASSFQSLPNNVYLHNVLMVNAPIGAIYQESDNTVLVAGLADNIIDMQSSEPTTYGTGYISSKTTNTLPVYKNRIFRLSLNDAGRISVSAIDDVFTQSSTLSGVTYTSSLYSLLNYATGANISPTSNVVNQVTKTPSNYTMMTTTGNNASARVSYDNTMPACINRSLYAFTQEGISSAVLGVDPVGNAIVVGSRQSILASGTITVTKDSTVVSGTKTAFSVSNHINRALFTEGGLYIGKITYVADANTVYLAEPALLSMTSKAFEISVNMYAIGADKRSLRSNLYAAVSSTQYTALGAQNNDFYTSTWGYFNNPRLMGAISVIAGSRSLGTASNIYDALGLAIGGTVQITTLTTSNEITIINGSLNQNLVGSYILHNATGNAYVGQIKEITSSTKAILYRKAQVALTAQGIIIRSSRQVVDVDGYASVAGNVILDGREYTGNFDFNATKSLSDVTVPDFIASSFDYNGAVQTFKIPHLFTDTTNTSAFMQTQTTPVSKIVRRGVFSLLNNANTSANLAPYRTEGYGIAISGHNTPVLVSMGAGTISVAGDTLTTYTSSSGLFTNADVGRSVYDSNKNFLGVISAYSSLTQGTFANPMNVLGLGTITVSGTTVTGVGTFFTSYNLRTGALTGSRLYRMNGQTPVLIGIVSVIVSDTNITLTASATTIASPTSWSFGGIAANSGFESGNWFPYQFNLRNTMSNDNFFSNIDQGIANTEDVAINRATSFSVNFAPNGLTSTNNMALYAYIAYTWRHVGLITASTTSAITVNGSPGSGTTIAIPKSTKLMIAPYVTIWSQSAKRYSAGQELYGIQTSFKVNYLGTIQNVVEQTDNFAKLAIFPYTYSQKTGFIPTDNPWSVVAQNAMVWINNKQIRGSQISNTFADVIGTGQSQSDPQSFQLADEAYVSIDNNANYIMPGGMRGVVSFTNGSLNLTGLNTSFVTTATTSNPVAANAYLYTLDGRSIGRILTRTDSTNATLVSNATFTNTNVRYRIGPASNAENRISVAANSNLAGFAFTGYNSISVIAIGTTTVTNDTMYFGQAGTSTISIGTGTPATVTVGASNFNSLGNGIAIFVLTGGIYQFIGTKSAAGQLNTNLLGVTLSNVAWGYSLVTVLATDSAIGRAVWSGNSATDLTTYLGVIKQLTTSSIVFDTSIFTNNLGSYAPVLTGTIVSSIISVASTPLKWAINPGDVLRRTVAVATVGVSGTIIGQVEAVNIPNNQVTFTTTNVDAYGASTFLIQRGIGLGTGTGFVSTITSDTITGTSTFFSNLPLPYSTTATLPSPFIGTYVDIYVTLSGSSSYTLVARAHSYVSDTELNVTDVQFNATQQTYNWYYVVRNVSTTLSDDGLKDMVIAEDLYTNTSNTYIHASMPGLGRITAIDSGATITNNFATSTTVCRITGVNTVTALTTADRGITPTQFTYQIAPGDLIMLYNGSTPYAGADYYLRVVQVLSDFELIVTKRDGMPVSFTTSGLSTSYVVFKRTDEMVAFDNGVTGYANTDWQPLGNSKGHVNAIMTAKNGDVYVGGTFYEWNKASSSSVQSDGIVELSKPNRLGRMVVGLNSQGYVIDAYAAPIAGNTFTRNGFANGEVFSIIDNSLINPINGYIGSADTVMVGGSFTKTNDNIPLSSSLAILPSSSISSTMRQILNTDLAVLNTSLTDEQTVTHIQSSTRFRKYNDIVQTNVLDGINGNNVSVVYTRPVTINHTTQFKSVRVRGNASTYPIITISYSTNSNLSANASKYLYHLIQTSTGARIEFTNNQLTVYNGESIVIDLRIGRRSITSNLRGNLANALSPNSNFVDFVLLGSNNSAGLSTQSYDDYRVNVIGVHGDNELSVTISYIPRFWSFDASNLFYGSTKAGL